VTVRPTCSRRNFLAWRWCLAGTALLSACNSPYPESDERANVYYTTFTGEPETLDPGRAYGSFMYEILCQIVEPPFQYHLLKRPYALVPLTAADVPKPEMRQVAWQGKTVEAVVYTVRIRPGIQYQNHPCFVEANRRLSESDADPHASTGSACPEPVEGQRRTERIRLAGDVPSPSAPPPGCHFHPRCRHAMPVCKEVYPPETRLGSGRIVRCHLHGQ
jgi:oligopeptide/dipeptide ABC transporter ATP-binding protein